MFIKKGWIFKGCKTKYDNYVISKWTIIISSLFWVLIEVYLIEIKL